MYSLKQQSKILIIHKLIRTVQHIKLLNAFFGNDKVSRVFSQNGQNFFALLDNDGRRRCSYDDGVKCLVYDYRRWSS